MMQGRRRRAAIKGHDEALLSIARLEEEAGRVEEARTAYKRACGLIKGHQGPMRWLRTARRRRRGSRGPGSKKIVVISKPRRRCVAGRRSASRDADVHAQWARLEVDCLDRARVKDHFCRSRGRCEKPGETLQGPG